jgi:hypothetical protein
VDWRCEVAEEVRAVGQRLARPGGADVLDGDRHARERALVARLDRVGRSERALDVDEDEGVETLVERLDARQGGLDELAGGELACADEGGELGGGRKRRSVAVASVMAGA